MADTTDARLLHDLSTGMDQAAWREFHDRYAELIHGIAQRQGHQKSDCEDIVQEVFLALFRAMGGFRYDTDRGRFRSYLKTVTLRTMSRRARKETCPGTSASLDRETACAADDSAMEACWEEEWRQHHIRRAMARIRPEFNEKDRSAFSLYVLRGWRAGETAAELSVSVDQVYQAKSRILRRLSEVIAEHVHSE